MASATGTNGWVRKWVAAGAIAAACGGCRGCGGADERESAADARVVQPTMPAGMLMPGAEAGAGAGASAGAEAGAEAGAGVVRGRKSGAWVELQRARPGDGDDRREFTRWDDDSWFVSIDAMTALHEPFARALPGFDLFLPRLFSPEALVRLGEELAWFARAANGEQRKLAGDLAQIVSGVAAKKQSLWVLAPP